MPHYSVAYTREITKRLSAPNLPEKNIANGALSNKAQQRIKHACHWLKYLSTMEKKKLVFITLTLSRAQHHPDNFIICKMLQPFLKWLQRQNGCNLYVWKAEVQGERYYKRNERCIHFHITTNRFIHYQRVRNKWNQLQREHGYLNESNNSPSTEIRAVKNDKHFVNYMAKYLSKKETDPALTVNCKVWGCSRQLSRMNVTLGEDITDNFTDIMHRFVSIAGNGFKEGKYFTMYFTSLSNKRKVPGEILEAIAEARDKAKAPPERKIKEAPVAEETEIITMKPRLGYLNF